MNDPALCQTSILIQSDDTENQTQDLTTDQLQYKLQKKEQLLTHVKGEKELNKELIDNLKLKYHKAVIDQIKEGESKKQNSSRLQAQKTLYIDKTQKKNQILNVLQGALTKNKKNADNESLTKKLESNISTNVDDWDYCIVLKNPDAEIAAKNRYHQGISRDEALRLFLQCFRPEEGNFKQQTDQNQMIEQMAFLEAFDGLEDFDDQNQATTSTRRNQKQAQKNNKNQNFSLFQFHKQNRVENIFQKNKKFAQGGRFQQSKQLYKDSGKRTSDFLTLIRNLILLKLAYVLSFKTCQIISENGNYIYILIRADEDDLLNEAQRMEFNVQFEIGATDLMSLEPCDKLLRPFKFLNKPHSQIQEMEDKFLKVFSEFTKLAGIEQQTETKEEVVLVMQNSEQDQTEQKNRYEPVGVTKIQ